MRQLEERLRRLGIVSLRLSTRAGEHTVVARRKGGQTAVVTSRTSLELAIGRTVSVLELAASAGGA